MVSLNLVSCGIKPSGSVSWDPFTLGSPKRGIFYWLVPLPEAEPTLNPRKEVAWVTGITAAACDLAQIKRDQVSLNKNLLWLKIKCTVLSCQQCPA